MLEGKSDIPELNPDLSLTVLANKMKLPISYIYKELCKEGYFLTDESAKKAIQRKTKLNLTLQQCQDILSAATKEYVNDIKYKPVPDRSSISITRKKNFKAKQKEEAEKVIDTLKENEKNDKEFLDALYSLSEQPLINNNDFSSGETDMSNAFCKMLFLDFLSPQPAYILIQHTDAFKRVVKEPEILRFCNLVLELDEESKDELRKMDITISSTLSSVVESLSDKLLRDLLQMRNGNYEKMVNQKLDKYKADITQNKLDVSSFSEDEKNDLDYMAEQFFVEERWADFQERMEDDFSKDPTIPTAMVCLTDILKDIDLLIGFLCCNASDRELLLTKAQKLRDKEGNSIQRTTE